MGVKKEREYLTAIAIKQGLILLIEPNGEINTYRQRGISRLEPKIRQGLMGYGMLAKNWEQYKELPKHYSIEFEDEEIMGKAKATYTIPKNFRM